MTQIAWTETVPSGTSRVGDFPTFAISVWTAISTGLSRSGTLYWNAGGGASDASTGELAAGGSRPFYDVQSNSSAPNSQMTGRLFFASDTSRLLVYESAATYMVGSANFVEMGTDGGKGAWYSYSSFTNLGSVSSSILTFTFPTAYGAAPQIFFTSQNNPLFCSVLNSTTTLFSSLVSTLGAASLTTLYWRSMGTISGW